MKVWEVFLTATVVPAPATTLLGTFFTRKHSFLVRDRRRSSASSFSLTVICEIFFAATFQLKLKHKCYRSNRGRDSQSGFTSSLILWPFADLLVLWDRIQKLSLSRGKLFVGSPLTNTQQEFVRGPRGVVFVRTSTSALSELRHKLRRSLLLLPRSQGS